MPSCVCTSRNCCVESANSMLGYVRVPMTVDNESGWQAATPATTHLHNGLHDSCAADLLLMLTAYCLHVSHEQASMGCVH